MILEPLVQGAGGMPMHSPEELRAIFEVTRRHGVLFIADEVMTGCRTGRIWAHADAGIAPDLISRRKNPCGRNAAPCRDAGLTPGGDRPRFRRTTARRHFFTGSLTANPLACAVAVANQRLLAERLENRLRARIEAFWRRTPRTAPRAPGCEGRTRLRNDRGR